LKEAYVSLHAAFQTKLPGIRQEFRTLANRPIGG